MGHPQGRWSVLLMTQHGGIPSQFQGEHEGCGALPRNPMECGFFHPQGKTDNIAISTVSYREVWPHYQKYLDECDYESKPDIRQLYAWAKQFIRCTGLMPRVDSREREMLESDSI